MALNFMGLGFSFGAVDTGLGPVLMSINKQFSQLNDTLSTLTDAAQQSLKPAAAATEDLAKGVTEAADASERIDFGKLMEDMDTGEKIPDVNDSLGKLQDTLGGVDDKSEESATSFGRTANSILGGAGKITGAMGFIGMAIGPVLSGFGALGEKAGEVFDTLTPSIKETSDKISELANDGINLTNSLEAEAVGIGTSARAIGANYGYLGEELNEFTSRATSMAMSLNIGPDQAAAALRGWTEATEEMRAIGFENVQDLARFTAGFGVNADQLRNSTMQMRREFGMTPEQINKVVGSTVAFGRASGDVAGALGQLEQQTEQMRRQAANMGVELDPERLADFQVQAQALGTGLFQVGQNSDQVREAMTQISDAMIQAENQFHGLFAGVQDDMPQFVSELAIATGDVENAFGVMEQGPQGFVQGMVDMVAAAKENGELTDQQFTFINQRLQQVLGEDAAAQLTNFMRSANSEILQTMTSTATASANLSDMGRQAHRTGRTLDEVFERVREGARTAFRSLARPEARQFVQDTAKDMRTLADYVKDVGEAGGWAGAMFKKAALADQIGPLALLPEELRSNAVAADEMQRMMQPLIKSFTSFSGLINTASSLVAMFSADVTLTGQRIKQGTREMQEATGKTREELQGLSDAARTDLAMEVVAEKWADSFVDMIDNAEKWITEITNAFADFEWDELLSVDDDEKGITAAIGKVIKRIGEIDWDKIWNNIKKGLDKLFGDEGAVGPWLRDTWQDIKEKIIKEAKDAWDAIPWKKIFKEIGGIIKDDLWENTLKPALKDVWKDMKDWLKDNWKDIMIAGIKGLGVVVGVALVAALLGALVIAFAPMIAFWGTITAAVLAVWDTWGEDIKKFFKDIGTWFEDKWEDISKAFEDAWEDAEKFFNDTWEDLKDAPKKFERWIQGKLDDIVNWFKEKFPKTTEALSGVIEKWKEKINTAKEALSNIWTGVKDHFINAWKMIKEKVKPILDTLSTAWTGLKETAGELATKATEFLGSIGKDAVEGIKDAWNGIKEFFSGIFQDIKETVEPFIDDITGFFDRLGEGAIGSLDSIMAKVLEIHGDSVSTVVGDDMERTEETVTGMANRVSATLHRVLFQSTVRALVEGFRTGFGQVIENMEEFSGGMAEHFRNLADTISGILTDLFTTILDQTTATLDATSAAVESIISRLQIMTEANRRLAEARGTAAEAVRAQPEDTEAMRRRMEMLQQNPVLESINYPDWWDGPGGYKELFNARMRELTAAVHGVASTTGGQATGEGGAAERIRQARERVTGGGGGMGHNRPRASRSGTYR